MYHGVMHSLAGVLVGWVAERARVGRGEAVLGVGAAVGALVVAFGRIVGS